MKFNKLVGAAVAAVAMTALPTAQAAPELRFSIDDGVTFTTCADGAACDLNATVGVVTVIDSFGAFNVNVTTGIGGAVTPTNLIDLNSIDLSSGAGSLIIDFSDVGYTEIGVIVGSWGGTISGAGSVTATAYASTTDALFAMDSLLGTLGPYSGGAFAGSFTADSPASGPYSLTQRIYLQATGAMSYSGDFELKVPEPGALALLGIGLAGVGFMRRRRTA